jgi:putative two-component system response regulator
LTCPRSNFSFTVKLRPFTTSERSASPTAFFKRGPLTREEVERMKAHTSVGAAMLAGRNFPLLEMAEEIALGHHERRDGTGYPRGIDAEAIPLAARIVAVGDVIDVLTQARPHEKAWTVTDAITEISRRRGKQVRWRDR